MRYGDKPEKEVKLRILWELKHIIDAGFVDYYVMAFWIFRHMAQSMKIGVWGRGAMPSSIVCYCLGVTEVYPIKYGLHSARFVNENPPKFQFDVEASRFDEFMKGAEELLAANAKEYDIRAIRQCLFCNIMRASYLSKEKQRPLPEDMDDELARYALYFPQTMDLYDVYVQNPKSNILIYQEQMLDILKETSHVPSIKANLIRLSIQRSETEQVEAFKKEAFDASDLPDEEKEKAWQRLINNPRAFLKAHAVSRVLSSYKYETK
jgi:DNA polymerase III alpha subunit